MAIANVHADHGLSSKGSGSDCHVVGLQSGAFSTPVNLHICSGRQAIHICAGGRRYLNHEKVLLDRGREFKYDSRAFADFGKVPLDTLLRLELVMLTAIKFHLLVAFV